jgi:hypothetical protein
VRKGDLDDLVFGDGRSDGVEEVGERFEGRRLEVLACMAEGKSQV